MSLTAQEAPLASGTQPVLAILGYYQDTPPSTNTSVFQDLIFGSGKSVREYYNQASYGQLQLNPASESFGNSADGIVGWVNLGQTHPNPGNQDWDAVQTMVASVLRAADPYVNFADFDKDGDKAISSSELHIMLIIAGFEASYNGGLNQPSVWGHKWSLGSLVSADGVSVAYYAGKGSYTMLGEMMGTHPSTIGIMVHELGHEFGWPDLYGTGSNGLGNWDVMSFGGWNTAEGDLYAGQTPPLPNAYLQKTSGWIDHNNPTQLVPALNFQNTFINLSTSTLNPYALILPVDADPSPILGEFFIVENRAKTGFDVSLPGAGALIWHINETSPNNNDPQKLRVKLIQADGADHLLKSQNFGDAGDAFTPTSINTRFGVGTPLSSAFANGEPSNILLTFDFSSGFSLSSIASAQPMGVMVNQVIGQTFIPLEYPYAIYLPLAQR